MTSKNDAMSQFADLSPQQRQLLFEKIRQRKLNSARQPKPHTHPEPNPTQGLPLSPHQQSLLAQLPAGAGNRMVEFLLEGPVNLAQLEQPLQQLQHAYPILGACPHPDTNHWPMQGALTPTAVILPEQSAAASDALTELRLELQTHRAQPALKLVLAQGAAGPCHLLLAAHPLVLDSYSLLRLGNQLLSMLAGRLEAIDLPDNCHQAGFAAWSRQVLGEKFLASEWNRLAPAPLKQKNRRAPCVRAQHHHEMLDEAFLEQHLPSGISAKQWLCDGLHQTLYSWLSHEEVTYWFADPTLKDSSFENLLGYFPYYVPVQGQRHEGQTFDAAGELAQLHTRYSPVSEQLAQALCQQGASVPLVHYHWFDVDTDSNNPRVTQGGETPLAVLAVQHLHAGLMLAPFEVHIVEQARRMDIHVHYDPDRLGRDQVQFLLRDLLALLKRDQDNDPANRPSLGDQLRAIWKELLQVPDIAPGASFFELGGHSLQVTEMKFRIKQQLKLDIPISVLYELPTIEQLANFIIATQGNSLGWSPEQGGTADAATGDGDEEEGTL
ncbi:MAG: acyl carrier protein [Pseudomonadota bacterium]|nr:acyl carrier protein [Pseudomonadota bacterium]